ncbi:MAG: alpha/beta fold hydrolase [Neisseriaceae bacterium]|nr:alpha/beta fold hydrolase [Neisseriaceae bacterium]
MHNQQQDAVAQPWLFLLGASGNQTFWQPLAQRLGLSRYRILGYPGFDGVPRLSEVDDFKSLSHWVKQQITEPSVVVAQSMGGVLAALAALAKPQLVSRLVLVATSGGLDVTTLGAQDWVADYQQFSETAPDWFCTVRLDLTDQLALLSLPTLLIWGDADPISPVAVGERLAQLMPQARLALVTGGQHDLGHTHAAEVAELIQAFMAESA